MKSINFIAALIALLSMVISPAYCQINGCFDDFGGNLKMLAHPYFSYHQANGRLRVEVRVPNGARWQGFVYEIGDTLDLSNHGMLNLRLKSDFDFLLTVYLIDVAGLYKTANQRILKSDSYVDYFIQFEMTAGFDRQHITRLQFTPNGNTPDGVIGTIWLDELRVGSFATPRANIAGITEQRFFVGSQQNQLKVLDLKNASHLVAAGASASIANIQISDIRNGSATVIFDCLPQVTGRDTLLITAVGLSGFANNSLPVPFLIEDNAPPSVDPIADRSAQVGDTVLVQLSGISDGNQTVEQVITISATSQNHVALPDSNIKIRYQETATVADLLLIPRSPAKNIQITLTLDDGFAYNHITQQSFILDCYQQFNHPPTLDEIPNQLVYLVFGTQVIKLTGIGDGDDGSQTLTIVASSSDTGVVKTADLLVNYLPGASVADLVFTPSALGKTEITITITDDGGNPDNNGDAQISRSFVIESAPLPQSGLAVPLEKFGAGKVTMLEHPGDWNVEGYGATQKPELGTFHGKENVLKIATSNKTCWTGIWYLFDELDLSQHRYMCYDIFFEGGSFSNGGKTHSYVWDVNDNRNLPRAHDQRKTVPAGQWRTVFMDYRGAGGMNTDAGQEIDAKRINRILINYATDFVWPFPVNSGTVYLANIKVGSAVPDSLIPKLKPVCTIDPIPDQTVTTQAGQQQIQLTGIGNGVTVGIADTIIAVSKQPTFVPDPIVSRINPNGTAHLTFEIGNTPGTADITVTVKAQGSSDYSDNFKIYVVDPSTADAVTLTLDLRQRFQTIRGFGTFEFSDRQNYIDTYTTDLGASAIRIGLIGNQIEPVNDNSDPNVLNMYGLNYDAFDFDYFRQLKAKGIETFILTSWSPPAWMKRNLSLSYGYAEAPNYEATDNILEPFYYDEFAESMVAAIRMFRERAGIELYAIGPQNEPAFNEPYPSAVLSPVKYAELIAVIGPRLHREGLATKIYMPEQVFSQSHYSMEQYINALRLNTTADQFTGIIATHGYAADGIGEQNPTYQGWTDLWNGSQSCGYPKELWMSETYPEYRNWQSAFSLAGAIHGALVHGNVSLWTLWSIEGTLMDKGKPTASFYTSKNYYKFIRPGAQRIAVSENHNDLLASAFIDPRNRLLTSVLINKSTQPLKVTVSGDSIPTRFDRYVTAEHINFQFSGSVAAGQMIILPAKSVTTLVGSMAGELTGLTDVTGSPQECQLYQNYPNPFNAVTHIEFSLARPGEVMLDIYNILGQKVRTLAQGYYQAGQHRIVWDSKNDGDQWVASGIYFYRFRSDKFIMTRKCILLR